MRYLRRATLVLCTALAACGAAAATPRPSDLAAETNFTQAQRPESGIRFVVIHVSEGSFLGTISWLRDPRAHASANFVVGRDGDVRQLVPLHDIAWHAGNWAYNVRSVGIENVGFTDDPAGFTLPEYRASARLAAVIARRALIPIDRRHIIGHYQVPDPNDPLQGGGIDNHTDPGKYWNWNLFINLVRRFAYPQRFIEHKHVGLQIESSTVYNHQVVAGEVPWRTKVGGPVHRVSFLVDGKVRWTDRIAPFAFAGGKQMWNTFGLRNGKHRLELRAYGAKSWTRHAFTVRVKNEPFTLAPVNLKAKQSVTGVVPVSAVFTGLPPSRVLLYLDGREIDHDTSAPYLFKWDTRRAKDGMHVVTLAGRARDGRVVRSRVQVVVTNGTVQPAAIVSSSLAEGQTVSGLQHWVVDAKGSVARVELSVDGTVRATVAAAPYAYDWDTSGEAPGPHQLSIRAVGADGNAVTRSFTVTVSPPAAP
jgi:N-acetyl-anhydromuramyl-L-alanine amidase AmpD